MVFEKVLTIRGVLFGYEHDAKFFGIDTVVDFYEKEDIVLKLVEGKKRSTGLKLFSYPCCSELREKYFIIGQVVCERFRAKRPCDNKECNPEDYEPCDKCFGYLVDGSTCNPEKILNEVCFAENIESCLDEQILGDLEKLGVERNLGSYLMLDDCTFCS